jgi:hydrogenase maturation protease
LNKELKILVYGYGNPGRQDDGLGIKLVNELEQWASQAKLHNIRFESNYQLNIEDAEIIRGYDLVIFADASLEEIEEEVTITRLDGDNQLTFTTHAASPGYIVHLCQNLFGVKPDSYLVHIRGYEWEFFEGLSLKAQENLKTAMEMMKEYLTRPQTIELSLT